MNATVYHTQLPKHVANDYLAIGAKCRSFPDKN